MRVALMLISVALTLRSSTLLINNPPPPLPPLIWTSKKPVLENDVENEGAEEQWNMVKEVGQEGVEKFVPDNRRRKRKPWMTEILDMMEERRQLKGRAEVQYMIKNSDTS